MVIDSESLRIALKCSIGAVTTFYGLSFVFLLLRKRNRRRSESTFLHFFLRKKVKGKAKPGNQQAKQQIKRKKSKVSRGIQKSGDKRHTKCWSNDSEWKCGNACNVRHYLIHDFKSQHRGKRSKIGKHTTLSNHTARQRWISKTPTIVRDAEVAGFKSLLAALSTLYV